MIDAVVIVAGGSKGYGRGIAEALVGAGAKVWITGRDEAALKKVADELGVYAVRADASSSDDWDRLFETVLDASGGRIDVLINNAGAGVAIKPLAEQSDDDIRASIDLNLVGPSLGCRRVAPVMQKQGGGTIINISSVCVQQAWPGWSVYSAAKAGLNKASHGLHTELRSHGVRVCNLIPSWGATGFTDAADLGPRDEETATKCMQPSEMGKLVLSLCRLPAHLTVPDSVSCRLFKRSSRTNPHAQRLASIRCGCSRWRKRRYWCGDHRSTSGVVRGAHRGRRGAGRQRRARRRPPLGAGCRERSPPRRNLQPPEGHPRRTRGWRHIHCTPPVLGDTRYPGLVPR